MKDLIVLVADSDQKALIETFIKRLIRTNAISTITFEVIKNPMRDPGNFNDSPDFLRHHIRNFRFAIVLFDFEGSGANAKFNNRTDAENDLEKRLARNGWKNKSAVIIIEPEIEIWLWANKYSVANAIGWKGKEQGIPLHKWLEINGWLSTGKTKPFRPKECYEEVLKRINVPRSSSIFSKIADSVSYNGCIDESFQKFFNILKNWFSK
jgi:hypothetical protein